MKRVIILLLFIMAYSICIYSALPEVDLEIVGPAVLDPSEPIFSDKVTITLYIYNYGPENINGPVKADWRINGKSIGQSVIMGLPAGEQKEIKNSFKVKDKINKLKVSIVTSMVPYSDSYIDNNIYEEEITLVNLMEDQNTSNSSQNIESINNGISNKKRNEKTRVDETSETSGSSGNTTETGSTASAKNATTNQTSNKTQGNNQNSSGNNTSNKDQKTNPNSNSIPTFDNSELARTFAAYVTSYIKLYAKLNETLARESDAGKQSSLSTLKNDIDALHSLLVAINKTNANGSASSRGNKIDWNGLQDLLSKIEAQLDNFDELESSRDDYVDNADDFISKSKEKIGT